ncbi:pre-mRNA-splicing factor 38-like [Lycorma delicatula]|uniref:pre-mRNA-splicing factor 38-like n=1 Tax=Lycorma delicatula TaxID=130591 RepID=UPI003F511FF6
MANRTVKDAKSVRGTNPQYLVDKIIRSRVYDSKYWKEECFALSIELLVDKAMVIRYIGGVYGGNIKPTPFLCLVLKMLQIQPEKDIVVEFIKNEEFKYVRILGAFYMRLVGSSLDCYKYLEPLFNDNRKLRRKNRLGQFELVHVDEFIDELLREERVCDVILPRIQKRYVLEENNEIETKISALDEDFDDGIESSDEDEDFTVSVEKKAFDGYWSEKKENDSRWSINRKRTPDRDRNKERDRKFRDRHRERNRSRERRHCSKTPPIRHRVDDRWRNDDRENNKKKSPNRTRSPDRNRNRERKYRDKGRHRVKDRSRDRRHRSRSPFGKHSVRK